MEFVETIKKCIICTITKEPGIKRRELRKFTNLKMFPCRLTEPLEFASFYDNICVTRCKTVHQFFLQVFCEFKKGVYCEQYITIKSVQLPTVNESLVQITPKNSIAFYESALIIPN